MSEKILLIDGHSILNRAFYGLPDLTNAEGRHTGAVYGFLNIMFRIMEEEKPEYLTVAFDLSAPTFRHKRYEAYKGTRKPMPEELRMQVPVLKEVLDALKEKLGDNYGCCKLPTFTCDGKQVQMGSFLGCKIYGVNSQTAYPVDAMELAEYLTGEKAQIERYNVLNYGPSNVNALADDTISSNLALQALNAQSAFAVSQMVLGGFWTPAEAFGAELEAHSTGDLQTMLDQLVEQALAG